MKTFEQVDTEGNIDIKVKNILLSLYKLKLSKHFTHEYFTRYENDLVRLKTEISREFAELEVDDAKILISILHNELLTDRYIDGGTISARSHACHELVALRQIFDVLDNEL